MRRPYGDPHEDHLAPRKMSHFHGSIRCSCSEQQMIPRRPPACQAARCVGSLSVVSAFGREPGRAGMTDRSDGGISEACLLVEHANHAAMGRGESSGGDVIAAFDLASINVRSGLCSAAGVKSAKTRTPRRVRARRSIARTNRPRGQDSRSSAEAVCAPTEDRSPPAGRARRGKREACTME